MDEDYRIKEYNLLTVHPQGIPPKEFFAPVWNRLGDEGVWLAGGAVTRWLEGALHNEADFDLFSTDPYKLMKRLGEAWVVRESKFSWTLNYPTTHVVQVIKHPYKSIIDTLQSFDFTARMVGTDGVRLYASTGTLKDIANKRIVCHPSGDWHIKSVVGIAKYANRGYTVSHEESAEFMKHWGIKGGDYAKGY